jgi:DNA polymerase III sliding clamp (beta) subunit (PCNA family)
MASTTKTRSTSKIKNSKAECTLSIKPDILKQNLSLLTAGVNANNEVLDRLAINVGDSQCIFRVGIDVIVKIVHKARKGLKSEPVQVSCKQIKSFAETLDKSSQKIKLTSDLVTINNQRSSYSQSLITYKDNLPEDDVSYTPIATVDSTELKKGLQKILPFVDRDSKQIISGVCLEIKSSESKTEGSNSLELRITSRSSDCVSTTSIAVQTIESDDINPLETASMVITKKLASFLIGYADSEVTLSIGDNSVRFEWDNVDCCARTLKGNYPDVDVTLKQFENNDTEIKFNPEDLHNALKRQQVNSAEIEFKVEDESCDLIHATQTGSGVERIFCSNESGEKIKLDLSIDHLIKIVSSIESETVSLKLNLEPEEGEDRPSNPILIKDRNTIYCLPQLIEADEDEDMDE